MRLWKWEVLWKPFQIINTSHTYEVHTTTNNHKTTSVWSEALTTSIQRFTDTDYYGVYGIWCDQTMEKKNITHSYTFNTVYAWKIFENSNMLINMMTLMSVSLIKAQNPIV